MRGNLKLLRYALTIISAAALLAEYGFVGANMLVSLRSAAPIGTSPYTSSVEMCMNLFTPCSRALSSSTCVPYTFVFVNSYELPKLRSTCDCAAKWKMVSILCFESEVRLIVEDSRIIQSRAVVELVKRHNVVGGVCEDKVADVPTGAACRQHSRMTFEAAALREESAIDVHEAGTSCDKYVLRIG
jgi:hypothetical protein